MQFYGKLSLKDDSGLTILWEDNFMGKSFMGDTISGKYSFSIQSCLIVKAKRVVFVFVNPLDRASFHMIFRKSKSSSKIPSQESKKGASFMKRPITLEKAFRHFNDV